MDINMAEQADWLGLHCRKREEGVSGWARAGQRQRRGKGGKDNFSLKNIKLILFQSSLILSIIT
jgi:hypothetical protein